MKALRDKHGFRIMCGHDYCHRYAVKIAGAADVNNTLGQTHDCCSRHCPIRKEARDEPEA
jgi:hypothetical protein